MLPTSSYFICTLPRSGSWLLADLLENTGVAGRPREYFELPHLRARNAFPRPRYLKRMQQIATTPNGVLGIKFHWHQFEYAAQSIRRALDQDEASNANVFSHAFPEPRYIWLTRRDKVRQAVSYYRAIQSGEWWTLGEPAESGSAGEIAFDFAAIECLENMLMAQDQNWERYFQESEIDPLVLLYEELSNGHEPAVREVFNYLRIPSPCPSQPKTALQPQSDELNEEWAERYRTLKHARSTHLTRFIQSASAPFRTRHQQTSAVSSVAAAPVRAVLTAAPAKRPPSGTPQVMNGVEFRMAAPQRSGHHGIINWISAQCHGTILYLNDAEPGTNPLFSSTLVTRPDLSGAPKVARSQLDVFQPRDFLFVSYEDRSPDAVFAEDFETRHDGWLGKSGQVYNIIILRDAFNTFASRMVASWMRHKLSDEQGREQAVRLWKAYAAEMAGWTHIVREKRVFINFNSWFGSEDYRRHISGLLGLTFCDAGRSVVSGAYGGSSFDGLRFNGAAEQMQVLERWKKFAEVPAYRDLFRDRELVELSNEVFGCIPGTESLGA